MTNIRVYRIVILASVLLSSSSLATREADVVADQFLNLFSSSNQDEMKKFVESRSRILYETALEKYSTDLAYLHAWDGVVKELDKLGFDVSALANFDFGLYPSHPSPSYSAWVILAREYASGDARSLPEIFDTDDGSECDRGRIYALSILVEAGISSATDRLVEIVRTFEFNRGDRLCVKLAARGLLYPAFAGDHQAAREALIHYKETLYNYSAK
jgi:hypothetical protein